MKATVEQQQALLQLDEVDTHILQAEHRLGALPQRQQLADAEVEAERLQAAQITLETEISDLQRQIRRVETEIDQVRQRATRDTELMNSGQITVAKHLADLEHEVGSLKRRQAELEDAELEVMERDESLNAQLADKQRERAALEEQVATWQAELAEASAAIQAELEQLAAERAGLVGQVPAEVLAVYDRVRAEQGTGAALLRAGRCEGCHLELTSAELDEIRSADDEDLHRCEQCRRFLIRTAESGL